MNDYAAFVSSDPAIRFGRPYLVGTHIAVQDILKWLASGMTNEQIINDYPELSIKHIRAALAFAAHQPAVILNELQTRLI